jgi:hypothetical protein
VNDSPFDRLHGVRRNKQLRNGCLIAAGLAALVLAVFVLDPVINHSPISPRPTLFFGITTLVAFGLGWYFHLQYLSER